MRFHHGGFFSSATGKGASVSAPRFSTAITLFARLWLDRERPGDARQVLAPVYGQFVEGFEVAELCAARQLLDALPPHGYRAHRVP